jgi:branched-chain amino acid transport system permease protein
MQSTLSFRQRLSMLAVLTAIFVVAIPLLSPSYIIDQFTLTVVYAIAILGLNLVTGYGGAITLGHGAFFTLGAYATAILMMKYGWSALAAVPASALLCWISGLLFGYPALRLHGLYLALGTLALAVSVTPILKRFEKLTGGHQGIVVTMPRAPSWSGLSDAVWTYYICLLVAAALFLAAWLVVRGALGRSILALRDNPLVASVMSVNRVRTTTLLFAMSSFYAGTAGALFGMVVGFVSPDSFPLMLSLSFFIAGVVGGLTSISGAVFGALFIQFVPTLASDIDIALSGLVYGAALILAALLLPNGVAGAIERGWSALRSRRAARGPLPAVPLQVKDRPGA